MINRAAIILKYREPAVLWINESDPFDEAPGVDLETVNEERTVYLISDADADTPDMLDAWLALNFLALFESELEGWYTDPSLWPQDITLALFHAWFEVECHTVIVDTVDGALVDDET